MGNFDRKRDFKGGFNSGPKRGFGGGGSRGGFGGGRSDGPTMHPATCADCGNRCEVPFKPMGGKPVYCKNCFVRDDDGGDRRPSRPQRDFGGNRRDFGGGGFNDRQGQDRQMHDATCDECGNRCEVPFRPTGEKPVYCRDCFGGAKDNGFQQQKKQPASGASGASNEQFEELSKKLDKALKILEILQGKKEYIVEKPKTETKESKAEAKESKVEAKAEAPKEEVDKKTPTKKAAAKKAPAKKAAAPKKAAAKKAPAKKAAKKK